MLAHIVRTVSTVSLGYALAFLPALCSAGDDKSSKPTDWSAYSSMGTVVGEVVKADDHHITLRVTWYIPQVKGGSSGRRPPLHQMNNNYRNPYGSNRGRSSQPRVQIKEEHHDYQLDFVPETLVRTKKLPPKLDDKGKRTDYTNSEIDALRSPDGAPAYASTPADLAPGTIVEVRMIRDKTIPSAKVQESDLRVKYAIILGKDPNPPKDITSPKDDKKAKKKN